MEITARPHRRSSGRQKCYNLRSGRPSPSQPVGKCGLKQLFEDDFHGPGSTVGDRLSKPRSKRDANDFHAAAGSSMSRGSLGFQSGGDIWDLLVGGVHRH